jgi:D-alanyl-D-alanine carboxypeptidase
MYKKARFIYGSRILLFVFVALLISLATIGCSDENNSTLNSSQNNFQHDIDQMLSRVFESYLPGASVIAVQQGKIVFRKGFGLADLELNIPIEPDMTFRIGSLTKQFTAVAVFMLAERGKISLNDKITSFFPDSPESWQKITVEHLLTHSSGLQSYTEMQQWEEFAKEDVKPEQIVQLIKNETLLFSPGDHLYYSNSGYFLLGVIIENITGQKYGDFIEDQIFKPLGMKRSHFGSHTKIIPGRVKGYKVADGKYQNADYISMTSPFSAGGLLSSADDLAIFNEALYSWKLISETNVEKMTTPYKPKVSGPPIVGYGCEIVPFKERSMVCSRGAINGFNCYNLFIPDDRIYVAILQNNVSTEYTSEYLAKKIAAILIEDPYPEWQAISLPNSALLKYAGTYRIDENNVRKVIVEEDRIFTQRNNGSKLEILPSSETTFFYKGRFTYITFGFDDNGQVRKMIMHYEDGSQITTEKEG